MRRLTTINGLFIAWIALFVVSSHAQTPPPLPGAIQIANGSLELSQSVTVSVQPINELSIVGDVDLTISTTTVGAALNPSVNSASAKYSLTTNDANKKIIGSLDAEFSPGISLFILLGQPTGSISTQELLSASPTDLVTGIGHLAQSDLSITYTATASISSPPNGAGEFRTVTLTLMDN